ncbi:SDR family oxidoreductase [Rhizosphaericola mali]|uniref:SDR family oxidoreductase n=2 Tax=Rhizosphaericola mali TaxID=2545455 RepID=A0A5P2G511_9BACT|nr:SDR family oxidoreductase [Rhizosphaericola mali]
MSEKNRSEDNFSGKTLANKTALVTGGSRGIGRAIAEQLAIEGAVVAITYNSGKDAADKVVADIEKSGGKAFALHANLVEASTIPQLFEILDKELTERTGSNSLDILVNNAGNSGFGNLSDATPESWDTMFAVHARAPFFIVQSAIGRIPDGGRIINISSNLATQPQPLVPIYSAAKASVNALTHAFAMEFGARGITVNGVAPGWTRTDMNAAVRENQNIVKAIETDTALGRFGEATDIAEVVVFLASDKGGWITGQVVEASGGYRL